MSDVQAKSKDQLASVPYEVGVSYELCAGIVDQTRPLVEIAKSEILEETGYEVPISNIRKIFQCHAVGHTGNCVTVYYAKVTDDMKVTEGGGNVDEGEFIDLFYLSLSQAKDFTYNDEYSKPTSVVGAFGWFFMQPFADVC